MANRMTGGFLRDEDTGALVVAGDGLGGAIEVADSATLPAAYTPDVTDSPNLAIPRTVAEDSTINTPTGGEPGSSLIVRLVQDGTGGHEVTFPGGDTWTAAAGEVQMLVGITLNGTDWDFQVWEDEATGASGQDPAYGENDFLATGVVAENMPWYAVGHSNQGYLTSGSVRVFPGVKLRAGETYTALTFFSGTTAAVTPTNQWAGLARYSDSEILAISPDDTTNAWGSNAAKTFTFTTPYTPVADEVVYFFLNVTAGTVPTLIGQSVVTPAIGRTPIRSGNADTGKTTPMTVGSTLIALVGNSAATNSVAYAQLK